MFEKQAELIALLELFGFKHHDDHDGERRYVKRLVPTEGDRRTLSPLEFHISFGPPALRIIDLQTFITPIQPGYHRSLFPDAPGEQMSLIAVPAAAAAAPTGPAPAAAPPATPPPPATLELRVGADRMARVQGKLGAHPQPTRHTRRDEGVIKKQRREIGPPLVLRAVHASMLACMLDA